METTGNAARHIIALKANIAHPGRNPIQIKGKLNFEINHLAR
jgi:hypothetical protein